MTHGTSHARIPLPTASLPTAPHPRRPMTQHADAELADRLLRTIELDVLPLTEAGVAAGNKVFGAALLDRRSLETVLAETNAELSSPLRHGEMHLLERYHALPANARPASERLLFLSTHEPCSLCLSAITWSGFDNFFYLFSHADSRDEFAIPHDLRILREVFGREDYRRENAFWRARGIREMVAGLDDSRRAALGERIGTIETRYRALSERYQRTKADNAIPLR